jgi:hypothetical protein
MRVKTGFIQFRTVTCRRLLSKQNRHHWDIFCVFERQAQRLFTNLHLSHIRLVLSSALVYPRYKNNGKKFLLIPDIFPGIFSIFTSCRTSKKQHMPIFPLLVLTEHCNKN